MMFLIRTATNYLFPIGKAAADVMYSSSTLVVLLVSAIAEKERFAENMHVRIRDLDIKNIEMEIVRYVSESGSKVMLTLLATLFVSGLSHHYKLVELLSFLAY